MSGPINGIQISFNPSGIINPADKNTISNPMRPSKRSDSFILVPTDNKTPKPKIGAISPQTEDHYKSSSALEIGLKTMVSGIIVAGIAVLISGPSGALFAISGAVKGFKAIGDLLTRLQPRTHETIIVRPESIDSDPAVNSNQTGDKRYIKTR